MPKGESTSPPQRKKRPAISDVAEAAGVSRAAVSKVIRDAYGVSPAMRKRVEEAIEELGYRPRTAARTMRGQSFTIGIEIPQLGNDFFTQIMRGATRKLEGSGYQLVIAPTMGGESGGASALNSLIDRQVDGLLAISPDVTSAWLDDAAQYVPIVLLGRHGRSGQFSTVTSDDVAGVDLVMDHLVGLGHRRIAHLTVRTPFDTPSSRAPHSLRAQNYRRRMEELGAEPLVVVTGPYEDDAYKATGQLLQEHDVTAIFAANDTLAIGALRAIGAVGLAATDVSVVGYDDIDLAGHPLISLSTVDQFGDQMGERAAELLLSRITGERPRSEHVQLTPEFRARGSSASAPSS